MSPSRRSAVRREPVSRSDLVALLGSSLVVGVVGLFAGLFLVGMPLDLLFGLELDPAVDAGLTAGSAVGPLYLVVTLVSWFRQDAVGARGVALVGRADSCVQRASHVLGGVDLAGDPFARSALAALDQQRSALVSSLAALHAEERSHRLGSGVFASRWESLEGVVATMEGAASALADLASERARLSQVGDPASLAEHAALRLARTLEEAAADARQASAGTREVRAALESSLPASPPL